MANEKRLIDASILIRDLTAMKSAYDAIALDGIINALKEEPTVDAVEVVRCKDCKSTYINSFSAASGVAVCKKWSNEAETAIVQQDDFCSYGERREGE